MVESTKLGTKLTTKGGEGARLGNSPEAWVWGLVNFIASLIVNFVETLGGGIDKAWDKAYDKGGEGARLGNRPEA